MFQLRRCRCGCRKSNCAYRYSASCFANASKRYQICSKGRSAFCVTMKSVGMRSTSAVALLALTHAVWFALADVTAPVPAPASISETLAIVRTSEEFQQALKDAVENVVIVDHIDMRTAPIFSSALKSNAAVAGILDDADGLHTRTIRVRSGSCALRVACMHAARRSPVPSKV